MFSVFTRKQNHIKRKNPHLVAEISEGFLSDEPKILMFLWFGVIHISAKRMTTETKLKCLPETSKF